MNKLVFGLGLLALATPAAAQSPEAIAEAALEAAPVWDGHNDVPIQLRSRYGNVIAEFDFEDTSDTGPTDSQGRVMHTDFARLAESGGGSIPVIGVASSSIGRVHKGEPLGRYNLLRIARAGNRAQIECVTRGLEAGATGVTQIARRLIG